MAIMAAEMAFAVHFGAIGQHGNLTNGQAIQFAAQQHGWAFCRAGELRRNTMTTKAAPDAIRALGMAGSLENLDQSGSPLSATDAHQHNISICAEV
jgi:hypothetical protein